MPVAYEVAARLGGPLDVLTMTAEHRRAAYRGARPPLEVIGRIVIVVDDSIASGDTMHAAVRGLRQLGPARIVAAAPVVSAEACHRLRDVADVVVSATIAQPPEAVAHWYAESARTSDDDVVRMLAAAARIEPPRLRQQRFADNRKPRSSIGTDRSS